MNHQKSKINLLLLLLWILIGTALRFTHLDLKPAASIELATLIFSLGNSVEAVPVDRIIDLNTILQPLHFNPDANVGLLDIAG